MSERLDSKLSYNNFILIGQNSQASNDSSLYSHMKFLSKLRLSRCKQWGRLSFLNFSRSLTPFPQITKASKPLRNKLHGNIFSGKTTAVIPANLGS